MGNAPVELSPITFTHSSNAALNDAALFRSEDSGSVAAPSSITCASQPVICCAYRLELVPFSL